MRFSLPKTCNVDFSVCNKAVAPSAACQLATLSILHKKFSIALYMRRGNISDIKWIGQSPRFLPFFAVSVPSFSVFFHPHY